MKPTFDGALRRIPLVRIIIPFILGIVTSVHFSVSNPILLAWFAGFCLLQFLMFVLQKRYFFLQTTSGIFLYGLSYVSGFCIVGFQQNSVSSMTSGVRYHVLGVVNQEPQVREKTIKTIISVYQINERESWIPFRSNVLVYIAKDSVSKSLSKGDVIEAKGYANSIVDLNTNGRFSYKNYMARKLVFSSMYIPSYWLKIAERDNGFSIAKTALKVRNYVDSLYKRCCFMPQEQTVLSALMLGVRTDMSPEILHAYMSTGAMHILAVSGLHVGILYLVLGWCLFFMRGRILSFLKTLIIVVCIWFYAFMTGFSPSIERAAIMFSILAIARQFSMTANIYNTLAATTFISLVINPMDVFDVGFQLSYLAIIGIVYFSDLCNRWWNPQMLLLSKPWQMLTVSISAQILTLPLTMYYFGQIPIYFLLTNIIAIPVSFFVMILGIIIIPVAFVSSKLFGVAAFLLGKVVWFQNFSIKWISQLPHSSVLVNINFFAMLLLYSIVISAFVLIEKRRYQ